MKRHWLVAWLALFVLSACSDDAEYVEVPAGYDGLARFDPFLAGGRMLEELGYTATSQRKIPESPDGGMAMIVVPARAIRGTTQFDELLRWVERGGHLVVAIEGAENYNDWGWFRPSLSEEELELIEKLLEEAAIEMRPSDSGGLSLMTSGAAGEELARAVREAAEESGEIPEFEELELALSADPGTYQLEDRYGTSLDFELELDGSYEFRYQGGRSDEYTQFLQLYRGAGTLSVISHAGPMRNAFIGDADHAPFLLGLVENSGQGDVLFVFGSGTNFWDLVMRKGWRVVIATAVLVLFWLWRSGRRFGPVLAPVDRKHRATAFQLESVGGFFRRRRQTWVLVESARARVRARALMGHPHLAQVPAEEFCEFLAEACERPVEEVRRAMGGEETRDAATFTETMTTLQTLKLAL